MKVKVTLWGDLPAHLENRGRHIDLEVHENATVGRLKELLSIGPGWLATVDGQAALDEEHIREEAYVTLLAPMEGG